MVARINTVAFQGVDIQPIDVQVQISSGMPAFTIVGYKRHIFLGLLIVFCLLSPNRVLAMMQPNCIQLSREELIEQAYQGADVIFYGRSISSEVLEEYNYINPDSGETFDRLKYKIDYEVIIPAKGVLPLSKISLRYNGLQEDYQKVISSRQGRLWLSAKRYKDGLLREYKSGGLCNKGVSNIELVNYLVLKRLRFILATIIGISLIWLGYLLLRRKINGRAH